MAVSSSFSSLRIFNVGLSNCLRSVLVFCASVFVGTALAAEEDTIRAAYLYNFAKYIQWPDEQRSALRLCIVGDDDHDSAFESLNGKPVRDMKVSVRRAVNVPEIPQCDLLFVPAKYTDLLERVRRAIDGYPILVVTESSDSLPKGAMIAMIRSENHIVFEVDVIAVRQAGLQASGKMLQLARKVY